MQIEYKPSKNHLSGSLNDVGWSIGVEAIFYALFPVLILCFYKPFRLLWLLGLGLLYGLQVGLDHYDYLFYIPPTVWLACPIN